MGRDYEVEGRVVGILMNSTLLFKFSPILKYRIVGHSMKPTYLQNSVVIAWRWFIKLHIDDIVICKDPRDGRLIMKRIAKIENNKYYVLGDNPKQSTDSRTFGWLEKENIVAKVITRI